MNDEHVPVSREIGVIIKNPKKDREAMKFLWVKKWEEAMRT